MGAGQLIKPIYLAQLKQIILLKIVLFSGTEAAMGQVNYSLSFDGLNDYVQTGLSINTLPYTITCRFKSDVSSGPHSIVDTDVAGRFGNSIILGYADGDNTIDIQYHNGYYDSPFVYGSGTWYNATATYENGQVGLYVDGISIGSKTFGQGAVDGSNVRFGRHNVTHHADLWFDGVIDEVAIWDKVLSDTEINAIYNSGTTFDLTSNSGNYISSSDLIGYWNFNEGTGSIVRDLSGNGNDGTMIGGAGWSADAGPITTAKSDAQSIRYVPFRSKWLLMALIAAFGGWLVLRRS